MVPILKGLSPNGDCPLPGGAPFDKLRAGSVPHRDAPEGHAMVR
jgi:hypothetical protein